ncbi:MAG TPA: hypothetical protein ENI64_11765 [Gammaproteobacteria bacterium]|nr:hypothetical protein [Gammaproteobacteria bacterium]
MPQKKPIRILFLGMLGEFSRQVLESLLAMPQAEICGVISTGGMPATGHFDGDLPVKISCMPHIGELAEQGNLPWRHVDQLSDQNTADWITARTSDLILVACFSYRIPSSIAGLPALGSYNLHPSLLPAYRGPMPMFWQFRNAETVFGVTLHKLADKLDVGPVLLQASHKLVPGCTGIQMNKELGILAATLAEKFIAELPELPTLQDQDESLASYQGYPTAHDFMLNAKWSAKRAYIFMKGTQHWNQTYSISLNDEQYK